MNRCAKNSLLLLLCCISIIIYSSRKINRGNNLPPNLPSNKIIQQSEGSQVIIDIKTKFMRSDIMIRPFYNTYRKAYSLMVYYNSLQIYFRGLMSMRVSQQQQACAGYQGKASRDARKLASSAYYQYKSRSDLSNSFFDVQVDLQHVMVSGLQSCIHQLDDEHYNYGWSQSTTENQAREEI